LHSGTENVVNPSERRRESDHDEKRDPPLRVLVVDDDPTYQAYVAALTRRLGCRVDTAGDGEEALQLIRSCPYDVLIIDFEMPRMDGIVLITHTRNEGPHRDSYAVMLTSHDDVETKLTALHAGFDDFLIKAHTELELVAKLAAARRVAARQRNLDVALRDLYGLATHDELTGIFNRRFFVEETSRMLEEATPLCLILFDLDGFKQINDTFGHLAGDRVLRDAGALFQRNTRTEDLIARLGGDEFVMVVARLPLADVQRIAARLTDDIGALQWSAGPEMFGVGVTTGIASTGLLDVPSLERLLDVADRDLYKNKWLRKHPEERRPSLYLYPRAEGILREMPDPPASTERKKEPPRI
jgi:two-component system cell cycle response regulator